ncbi:hypothetical protein [Candidatus Nitrospira bockiana]
MNEPRDDFEEMTRYLTHEARWFALDSMACVFHNHGYDLQGNTEANDARWLADRLSRRLDDRSLEFGPEARQQELLKIARAAIPCLADLAERIGCRYSRISKAIRCMETISREQARQMQEQKRHG